MGALPALRAATDPSAQGGAYFGPRRYGLRRKFYMLADATDAAEEPAQRLAAMAGAYVRFAAQQRSLFDTIFNLGLEKSRHPELQRAWEPVDTLLIDGEYGEGPDAVNAAAAKAIASARALIAGRQALRSG
jgi:hypothetical protein